MGETVELPGNYERHIQLGKQAANQQNWATAIDHFEAAYALEQRFSLNILLASVLVENRQLAAALQLMQEKFADYLAEPDLIGFYIAVLLANKEFVEANELWQGVWPQMQQDAKQRVFWQTVKRSIERAQNRYREQQVPSIDKIQQKLYSIAGLPLTEQMQLLKLAKQLPQAEYLKGIQPVLVNPYVHPFVRSTIFEELVTLKIAQPIAVFWFDQVKTAIPNEIPLMETSPKIQAVQQAIQQTLADDPIFAEQVLVTSQLYLACLYPFENEVLVDSDEWTTLFLQELGLVPENQATIVSENSQAWFSKLQELVAKLMF